MYSSLYQQNEVPLFIGAGMIYYLFIKPGVIPQLWRPVKLKFNFIHFCSIFQDFLNGSVSF